MATSKRVCKDCNKNISKRQRQCKRCKLCQKLFRQHKNREAKRKQRLRNKENPKNSEINPMGTTDFDQYMRRKKDGTPNWEAEAKEIKVEMRKLGLRR